VINLEVIRYKSFSIYQIVLGEPGGKPNLEGQRNGRPLQCEVMAKLYNLLGRAGPEVLLANAHGVPAAGTLGARASHVCAAPNTSASGNPAVSDSVAIRVTRIFSFRG